MDQGPPWGTVSTRSRGSLWGCQSGTWWLAPLPIHGGGQPGGSPGARHWGAGGHAEPITGQGLGELETGTAGAETEIPES